MSLVHKEVWAWARGGAKDLASGVARVFQGQNIEVKHIQVHITVETEDGERRTILAHQLPEFCLWDIWPQHDIPWDSWKKQKASEE